MRRSCLNHMRALVLLLLSVLGSPEAAAAAVPPALDFLPVRFCVVNNQAL